MFGKGTCPICNKETSITNKSGLKYESEYICMSCSKKLANQGVNVLNCKKFDIEDLKQKAHIYDVKKGNILECSNCNGHNIEIISTEKNYKKKQKTTVNINPFKIFTIANTKEIKKETAKEHNEYFCKDCGHRWIGK